MDARRKVYVRTKVIDNLFEKLTKFAKSCLSDDQAGDKNSFGPDKTHQKMLVAWKK